MADVPDSRAEPDPEFADRLERVLMQRLTAPAGPRSRRGAAQSNATVRVLTDLDVRDTDILSLETQDHPTGHGPGTPRRHSPGRWLLVAAAVVVAVVGTLVVLASGEDEQPVDTITSAPTTSLAPAPAPVRDIRDVFASSSEAFPDLEPGLYSIDPDGDDATPLRVTYRVAAEGWSAWFGAVKTSGRGDTMLTITTMTNLVEDGCVDQTPLDPPVGPTVDDLATALSQLAPFEVTAPPTDVTLFGYRGTHLELTVPDRGTADCLDGELHSWISPLNDGGATSFSGYGRPGETEEFWILDVEGTRLVLVTWDSPLSSAEDVAERDAIFDSIRIEP